MNWRHYDLDEKWRHAASLVYGVPVQLPMADAKFAYDDYYVDADVAAALSIWPLPSADDAWLIGTGDLYAHLVDGRDRNGKFLPYTLKQLRYEESGWHPDLSRRDAGGEDATPRWYLAGQNASLFYGLMLKPGKVPSALPAPLETVRGQLPGQKAHPRAVVGVWLADCGTAGHVEVDPADAKVAAAKRALAACLPKAKGHGFIIVPTDPVWSHQDAAAEENARPPKADPWRARFETAYGPLEEEEGMLFSGRMAGFLYRLEELPGELLDAWARTPSFSFNDQAASVIRWEHGDTQLAILDITTDDAFYTRAVAVLGGDEATYLLELRDFSVSDLKALLDIPANLTPKRSEVTLGFG